MREKMFFCDIIKNVGFVHPVLCQHPELSILPYKSQKVAHVTEFILSDNRSICFGRHYHPSSGAQNNFKYSIW
jgi:hypothetical protein